MLENIENVVITKSHVLEVQLEIATNEEKKFYSFARTCIVMSGRFIRKNWEEF